MKCPHCEKYEELIKALVKSAVYEPLVKAEEPKNSIFSCFDKHIIMTSFHVAILTAILVHIFHLIF